MGEAPKPQKVKGAVMIGLAMIIKRSGGIDWQKQTSLTSEDLVQIKNGILASQWYDRSLWEKMSLGVWKTIGMGKPENAFIFGEGLLADTILKVYKGPEAAKDPIAMLSKFTFLYNSAWFNFGKAEFAGSGKSGNFKITVEGGIPIQECFLPMMRGVLSKLVRECGGREVKAQCPQEAFIHSQKLESMSVGLSWK